MDTRCMTEAAAFHQRHHQHNFLSTFTTQFGGTLFGFFVSFSNVRFDLVDAPHHAE